MSRRKVATVGGGRGSDKTDGSRTGFTGNRAEGAAPRALPREGAKTGGRVQYRNTALLKKSGLFRKIIAPAARLSRLRRFAAPPSLSPAPFPGKSGRVHPGGRPPGATDNSSYGFY